MVMHPVGPAPAAVYWRRRAVVALLLVAVLVFAWRAVTGDDTADATAGTPLPVAAASAAGSPDPVAAAAETPAPTPRATSTSTPTLTPAPTAAPEVTPAALDAECPDTALAVAVTTDARSYAAGTDPRFTLAVTNTGEQPCRRDLGPGALELVLTSGGEAAWSSDDCNPERGSKLVVLSPGQAWSTTVTWSRTISATGCDQPRRAAEAGSYELAGRVGTARSAAMPLLLR